MKSLIAISTLLLLLFIASPAYSACIEAAVPKLPDPDTAMMSDIIRAQNAVKQYLARQEKYLSCVGSTNKHDAAVDKMHEIAEQYNTMSRRYKSRQESMDMIVDLALSL
jgi:hypothetical protein